MNLMEKIADVITALANQSMEQGQKHQLYAQITQDPESILKVNSFHTTYVYPLHSAISAAVKSINKSQDAYIHVDVLINFWVYKNHIEMLLKKTGATSCVADMAKAILNHFVHHSVTGQVAEWNVDDPKVLLVAKIWHPRAMV